MTFFKRKNNARVIADLKKRSNIGIVFYILIVCIILFGDQYYSRNRSFSTLFLCSVFGICIFRFGHLYFSHWTEEQFKTINDFVFLASVAITALIWGMGFVFLFNQVDEPRTRLLMVICTAGLSAGGVVSFSPDLKLSLIFNFLMLQPACFSLFFGNGDKAVCLSIFLFSIYLVLLAYRGNKEYWNALDNEFLLKKINQIDFLTKLYNRSYFDKVLGSEFKRAARKNTLITMIICDIDHFKRVNDQYGHLAGDEFLKMTATILKETFKRETDIVARYGGEEFVILMPEEKPENAYSLGERARQKVHASSLQYNGREIKTTISMGVACLNPSTNTSKELLVAMADKALYQAKHDGRNKILWTDTTD